MNIIDQVVTQADQLAYLQNSKETLIDRRRAKDVDEDTWQKVEDIFSETYTIALSGK